MYIIMTLTLVIDREKNSASLMGDWTMEPQEV